MQNSDKTLPHVYKSDHAAQDVLDRYRHFLRLWPVPNARHFLGDQSLAIATFLRSVYSDKSKKHQAQTSQAD